MHSFKKLKVWQMSMDLVAEVYRLTAEFPKDERFGLISQINRTSVSIASNIAEGSGRNTNKDFNQFLAVSLGASFELETQLLLSEKLGMIKDQQKFSEVIATTEEIQKMIIGLQTRLTKELSKV